MVNDEVIIMLKSHEQLKTTTTTSTTDTGEMSAVPGTCLARAALHLPNRDRSVAGRPVGSWDNFSATQLATKGIAGIPATSWFQRFLL